MQVHRWMILYRDPGRFAWNMLTIAENTEDGIYRLIRKFNGRDVGKREWDCRKMLPGEME